MCCWSTRFQRCYCIVMFDIKVDPGDVKSAQVTVIPGNMLA